MKHIPKFLNPSKPLTYDLMINTLGGNENYLQWVPNKFFQFADFGHNTYLMPAVPILGDSFFRRRAASEKENDYLQNLVNHYAAQDKFSDVDKYRRNTDLVSLMLKEKQDSEGNLYYDPKTGITSAGQAYIAMHQPWGAGSRNFNNRLRAGLVAGLATLAGITGVVGAGTGALGAAADWAGSTALPWLGKALPYMAVAELGRRAADEGSKMYNGKTIGENTSGWLLENLGMPKNWADATGNIFHPAYFMPWSRVASGVASGTEALLNKSRFFNGEFASGIRDRYNGMIDAANYSSDESAFNAAGRDWVNKRGRKGIIGYGSKPGDIGVGSTTRGKMFGTVRVTENGELYPGTFAESGGNQTITTHLGGDGGAIRPGIMPARERLATLRFVEGAPKYTYFGEPSPTKSYVELYLGSKNKTFFDKIKNYSKATKDELIRKQEKNPYWEAEKEALLKELEKNSEKLGPVAEVYQQLLKNDNPLSVDSYAMILKKAQKDGYKLVYDSSPMGMFNLQGEVYRPFYESLQTMTPERQIEEINNWIRSIYPKARPAYIKDGRVWIPKPILVKTH